MPVTPFDPRPTLVEDPEGVRVGGRRCSACRYPVIAALEFCPVCGGTTEADRFGPVGTVSASTCLHVRVPGRTPPYAVAYVDLDDGPRVLVHTVGNVDPPRPVAPGSRVRLGAKNAFGDLTAVPT